LQNFWHRSKNSQAQGWNFSWEVAEKVEHHLKAHLKEKSSRLKNRLPEQIGGRSETHFCRRCSI
jgi:hypothetical protein